MAARLIYLNDKEFYSLSRHLGIYSIDGNANGSINLTHELVFMRDKSNEENKMIDPVVNIMTDKPKHIMTRAEASKIFADHMAWNKESCDLQIDLFVKLGMLEIKEEEKKLTLREIAVKFNLDLVNFLTILEENGYNIARDNS